MKSATAIRRTLAGLLAALAAGFLASCETAEGFGRDVRQAGQGIENTAERAQR